MSDIFRYGGGLIYFQIAEASINKLPLLKLDDFRLMLFLNSKHQQKSLSDLSLSGQEISLVTGIAEANIGAARVRLINHGLLLARKVGRNYRYTLCDPRDRTRVPDRLDGSEIDFDTLLAADLERYFRSNLKHCKPTDNGLAARCPFLSHRDIRPSFSVELIDGNGGRWSCAGCEKSGKLVEFECNLSESSDGATIDRTEGYMCVMDKLRALGIKKTGTGKPDVVFSYCDEDGVINSETVRPGGHKKPMYRRRPHPDDHERHIRNTNGCRTLLYKLPLVMEADLVVVVEGEPDVHRVMDLYLRDQDDNYIAATTNANGAGRWKVAHTQQLKGKNVILIGDNDDDGKGLRHMEAVKLALTGVASSIKHVILPEDFRDIGHYLESKTAQDLINLVGDGLLKPRLQP